MQSGSKIVANTTMESYVQNINTCYNCHVQSRFTPYLGDSVNNNVFGDFSFASYSSFKNIKAKLFHAYSLNNWQYIYW